MGTPSRARIRWSDDGETLWTRIFLPVLLVSMGCHLSSYLKYTRSQRCLRLAGAKESGALASCPVSPPSPARAGEGGDAEQVAGARSASGDRSGRIAQLHDVVGR